MICDEDPVRRSAGEIHGEEKATGKLRLNAGKYDKMGFQAQSNLQNQTFRWLLENMATPEGAIMV